ncbi:winged helix-turn-helix transcriptional regulator [Dictyobacter aurantiacus]|uniref:Putative HTH-type transcriptional regulator YdeP n=1 Tax=Dictyobacter aurantiacus TaxID=1936993 RepID=A0A401ZI16_9CHLR|nr:helix-turn-helix domain-containing protein [Dictyobacter aurantiacus]GCE06489.1 putative HTH-type transcriptional regulator YdeP [Dictyobacter aurantiacus]
MHKGDYQCQEPSCPTEVTVDVIGGKWKALILTFLLPGPRRFGEISRFLPHASKRMLTLQLRELEEDGVIHREIYKEVPPKVEYSLTPFGETLKPILLLMADWGEKYVGKKLKQLKQVESRTF